MIIDRGYTLSQFIQKTKELDSDIRLEMIDKFTEFCHQYVTPVALGFIEPKPIISDQELKDPVINRLFKEQMARRDKQISMILFEGFLSSELKDTVVLSDYYIVDKSGGQTVNHKCFVTYGSLFLLTGGNLKMINLEL